MDPKELRANAPLSISVNDDSNKYAHSSPTIPSNKTKSYHEIGANSMGKMDAAPVRPCAIIGPDRVHAQTPSNVYLKKASGETWPCSENVYLQPPDYPNKLLDYQPNRNISPRQTFQENMQRIMVPPTYSSIKNCDETSFKKTSMPQEAKYCEVPYNMTSVTNEYKSVRSSDISMPSVNPAYARNAPHYGWSPGVNVRPQRPYGASEFYPYPEYPSCVGPRSATMSHQHRIHREEAQAYSERLYQEANIRFKPYPISKEKHQARYDYINTYPNAFHPPVSLPPHKFDLQKSIQNQPYPGYPQVPLKFLDRRIHETYMDGYQRSNPPVNFNPPVHNQIIHPPYGPVSGNCVQNKVFPDLHPKSVAVNKLPYDPNHKIYLDLDTTRNKGYPVPENVYCNDINQHVRGEILLPNHPAVNMHSIPKQFYRRENLPLKHYEYSPHFRNLDQSINFNYSLTRQPLQYSPNSIAISPSDSNTSNETTHTMGTTQEDCGYVSQSSTTSVRSIDTGNLSIPKDIYRRQDYPVYPMSRNSMHINGNEVNSKKKNSSSKKNIDVRQFLQMWNESEEETNESNKEVSQTQQPNFNSATETNNSQEQLYVLGLVNVPSEELSKYEHIQKISKLPENIKGYDGIEILNQYEELLETPNINRFKITPKVQKEPYPLPKRIHDKENPSLIRPVSPLDVEAKISQSVIHKEVGCNFEIKPCSPEMLNVEVATPIQSIIGERIIEKVANPVTAKSPMLVRIDDNNRNPESGKPKINSCEMMNKQYSANNYPNIIRNSNYTVQDLESNSGLCLASLPQLDNDIELNFPEINQQFIKANQIESELQQSQKDLPQLNVEPMNINKNSYLNQNTLSPQLPLVIAPEKEFSKLSKFRKNKKHESIPKNNTPDPSTAIVPQQRINSVIIKNPDTVKLQEDNDIPLLATNKDSSTNSCNNGFEIEHSTNRNTDTAMEDKKILSFETAIDFSLSKIDGTPSYERLNKNVETHYSTDVNFHSSNIADKEAIVEIATLDLQIKESKEQNTLEERINLNINLGCSKNEIEKNVAISSPAKLLDNDTKEHIDKFVEENISKFDLIEEKTIEPETSSIIISKEKDEIALSLPLLENDRNEDINHPIAENVPTIVELQEDSNGRETALSNIINEQNNIFSETVNKNDPGETENNVVEFSSINNINDKTGLLLGEIIEPSKKLQDKIEIKGDQSLKFNDTGIDCKSIETIIDDDIIRNEKEFDKELKIVENHHNRFIEKPENNGSINEINSTDNRPKTTEIDFANQNDIYTDDTVQSNTDKKCNSRIDNEDHSIHDLISVRESKQIKDSNDSEEINKNCDLKLQDNSFTAESFKVSKLQLQIDSNKIGKNDHQISDQLNNADVSIYKNENFQTEDLVMVQESPINFIEECKSENVKRLEILLDNLNCDNEMNISELNVQLANTPIELFKDLSIEYERNKEHIQQVNLIEDHENIRKEDDPITISPSFETEAGKICLPRSVEVSATKNKSIYFNKKLFSSCIQNLIIHTEGNCKKRPDVTKVEEKILFNELSETFFGNSTDISRKVEIINESKKNYTHDIAEYAIKNLVRKPVFIKHEVENCKEISSIPKINSENNEENSPVSLVENALVLKRNALKRSLSESALEEYREDSKPSKRKKGDHNILDPISSDDLCNIIQSSRRNSISTICNENNVYILIDNNFIIAEENDDSDKIYYTEVVDGCEVDTNDEPIFDSTSAIISEPLVEEINTCESASSLLENLEVPVQETWVDDVACIETVVSDDITEDIDVFTSSRKCDSDEESNMYYSKNHLDKIKDIYGSEMCSNDTQILKTLYMTPQMNVNKTLSDIESHNTLEHSEVDKTMEYSIDNSSSDFLDKLENEILSYHNSEILNEKENICKDPEHAKIEKEFVNNDFYISGENIGDREKNMVHSCESYNDYINRSPKRHEPSYSNSSSPEVSSTTSEEKNSSILLKITNYNGSRVSEINDISGEVIDKISYKLTEKNDYQNYNCNFRASRTLITKAAQKYIPPLKDTIGDLKIKLTLPQHRLHSLKQLKISKTKQKVSENLIRYEERRLKRDVPKKQKPKFEDVLKSIDEIQFKKHKDKVKKGKNIIPKVVIKKNENGAHYTSSKTIDNDRESYNPDLTGRKWQPWVFLEKNSFVDKMALKKKVKAVYCHRKNSYVLEEKFRKYKSIYNANFVITQPSSDSSTTGNLKYTIKLKHK